MKSDADAPTMPGDPERVYASMGNYIFSTNLLLRELYADAQNEESSHDFGRDILPSLVGRTDMFAYDFQTNRIPGDPPAQEPYWRDVGTIDAYLRRQHGPARRHARSESVQSAVAAAHGRILGRARQVYFRPAGPPRPGDRFHRRRRNHSFRRHGAQFGAGTRRARAFRRVGGGFDSVRQLSTSAGARVCAARSWTRTCVSRKTAPSATTWTATASCTTSPTAASW